MEGRCEMDDHAPELLRQNSRLILQITIGIVLMSVAVIDYIGLWRTICFSVGIGLIAGAFEGYFLILQMSGGVAMKSAKKNGFFYLALFTGLALAVTAFIGVFDFITNLMFGLGLGLVVASLDALRRKI